jgi:MOB kinase activator 1
MVKLPEGEDINEWLAAHVVDFYKQIHLLFGTVKESCTTDSCPVMNAGSKWEFHWCDGKAFKKPTKLSAPEYVDQLFIWTRSLLDDESIMPTQPGINFPKKFETCVKQIFKRLSRVYAHLYMVHFETYKQYGVETVLNTSFKHFIFFVQEFQLISKKDLLPLEDLIKAIGL